MTVYLWCRAWPWVLPEFSLDGLADLEGQELIDALDARARSWNAENPGKLEQARQERDRRLAAIKSSLPTMPSTSFRGPRRRGEGVSRPVTFEEVAPLASWALHPGPVVVSSHERRPLHPTPRVVFFAAEQEKHALRIVEALRRRVPRVPPGRFGSGHALLEYGMSAPESPIDAIVSARALEDFNEERQRPDWAVQSAEEAARILELLEDRAARRNEGSSESSTPRKPPSAGEQAALNSYRWALTTRPELDRQGERNYAEVYGFIKGEILAKRCPFYASLRELPSFGTWPRYVREAMEYQAEVAEPDDGPGGAVVRQEDV